MSNADGPPPNGKAICFLDGITKIFSLQFDRGRIIIGYIIMREICRRLEAMLLLKKVTAFACALALLLCMLNTAAVSASALENTVPAETAAAEETVPMETEAAEDPYVPRSYCDIPLYLQTDYPNVRYGSGSIATSGCSVTCLAMVATYLTGHTYMPDELADYFSDYNSINHMEKMEYMSDMLQLPWEKAENFHVAMNALKEGKIVIALMNGSSLFTNGQHFIVLADMTEDGKILVNDPNAGNYSLWNLKNAFINGFTEGDICLGYSGAWIYDPSAMPEEPFVYTEEKVEVECRYPGVELTLEEQTLLAKMVWVEAQGEPFEGQQAIAEIVLNRLMADNFQSTVKGVIYAENQFRSTAFLEDAEPTNVQYEAVERALEGPYVLPIDVVFFATYPVNKNVWGEIGGHIFCYQQE